MVEHYLAKVNVASSNLVSRSIFIAPLDKLVKSLLSKGRGLPVRIRGGVPSGLSIMDNTAVFYTVNMGSIPVGRTIKYITGFGEMDIMLVFETSGVGSIPASPAR